ncbi:phosphoribosylglycinamide formyltransferase [Halocola ammonii]
MTKIAILASGTGTNARAIIDHFAKSAIAEVALVITNKPNAGVIEIAKSNAIAVEVIPNSEIEETLLHTLKKHKTDLVVLAGFLRKIPVDAIRDFEGRMVNIHPSLLPKHGGKGMYGSRVHEAVVNEGDNQSGITIHLVNENYDEGKVIFQVAKEILPEDTAETVAKKVQKLEHKYYPEIIEQLIKDTKNN